MDQCMDCGGLDDIFEHHVKYELLGEIYHLLGAVSSLVTNSNKSLTCH